MIKRLLLLGGIAAAMTAALVFASSSLKPEDARASHGVPLQNFEVDVQLCINADPLPAINLGNAGTLSVQDCSAEPAIAPGVPAVSHQGVALKGGNRTGLPFSYSGPGWIDAGGVTVGTTVGGVRSFIDLLCDSDPGLTTNIDAFADSSGVGTLEQFVKVPFGEGGAFWNANPDPVQGIEGYLDTLLPPGSVMSRIARYRADVDTIYLNGSLILGLTNPTPLNSVSLAPSWRPSVRVSATLLAGGTSAPSTQLLCLDSPQSSLSRLGSAATIQFTPFLPGRYPRWTAELSNPDAHTGLQHFLIFADCKVVGAAAGSDADGDCLSTVPQSVDTTGDGTPELTFPADTNDANPDVDGDGLLDGIEVSWGSSPTSADTDGDGRTDLEEMVGPTQLLSDPTVADTDGDGVLDGGFILDENGDGTPDVRDNNGDGTGGDVGCESRAAGDHLRCGFIIQRDGGTNLKWEGDNCPNISNPAQANWDFTNTAGGDLYGDACDGDDDADGIVDAAEAIFVYQNGAAAADKSCRVDGDFNDNTPAGDGQWQDQDGSDATIYPVTPLNPLNPDTDGDGFLDGIECNASRGTGGAEGGSNPNSAAVVPRLATGGELDGDGIATLGSQKDQEQTARTVNFSGNQGVGDAGEDVDGDGLNGLNDCDSDGDLIPDGIEYLVTGTSAINPDSDGDGISDGEELPAFRKAACGQIDNGSGITSVDGSDPALKGKGTVPQDIWAGAGGNDADMDGLNDNGPLTASGYAESCVNTHPSSPFTTYANQDGRSTGAGDGTSWDNDGDGVRDGAECSRNTDPTASASKPSTAACGGTTDTDLDGLTAAAENCKWGTSPTTYDSDGDGLNDCIEANDNNGDNAQNFPGDTINSAKAANNLIEKTADFDLNGDGVVNFPGDTIQSAKMANKIGGICL